jgi:hypothetical protein
MYTINLDKTKFVYDFNRKTFIVSEKGIPFGTEYEILNPKTGGRRKFKFTNSTGPEFDPNTKWIYESNDGILLEVCNDKQMTKIAAKNYLNAKLR